MGGSRAGILLCAVLVGVTVGCERRNTPPPDNGQRQAASPEEELLSFAASHGAEWVSEISALQSRSSSLADDTRGLSPQARALVRGFGIERAVVQEAPDLGHLPALERLLLPGVQLRDIGRLSGLPLTYLDLSANEISDLSPLAECRELETLLLDWNPVEDISALRACGALRVLHLSRTSVSHLPDMSGLGSLRDLWLSSTPLEALDNIETIPSEFDLNVMRCAVLKDLDSLLTARVRTLYIDEANYERLEPWFSEHLDEIRAKRPEFRVEFRYVAGE